MNILGSEGDEGVDAFQTANRQATKRLLGEWVFSMLVHDGRSQLQKCAALRDDRAVFKQDTLEIRIGIARCMNYVASPFVRYSCL